MDVLLAVLALGAVLCVAEGLGGLLLARQRALVRRVGSFSCMLRKGAPEGAWRVGVAQFAVGRLIWWSSVSLSPRPAQVWTREDLVLTTRHLLGECDDHGRPLLLVHRRHRGEDFAVIIPSPACTGLVSWLESAPRRLGRVT